LTFSFFTICAAGVVGLPGHPISSSSFFANRQHYCICLLNLSPFILSYHFMFLSQRKSFPSPPHITPPGYVLVPLNNKTKSVLSQLNSHKILQPASSFPTSITSRHISDYNDNVFPSGILPSSLDLFGGSCDCVLDGCGYGEYIQQQHGLGPSPSPRFCQESNEGASVNNMF
jgi:hypothetical protein